MIADDLASADALASLYDAGALQVPPWMALTVALASVRPAGLGATIDWLVAHRAELERAYADGGAAPLACEAVTTPNSSRGSSRPGARTSMRTSRPRASGASVFTKQPPRRRFSRYSATRASMRG